jgi:perosamine synthetase
MPLDAAENDDQQAAPWPRRDPAVLAALEEAWSDGSWGRYQGPHCQRLSDALATYHGVEHVLLCCSGTFAVELALRGLKIQAGDEVILAGYDFPGNFRAIEAIGAIPVLVDIGPDNWSIDPELLAAAIGPSTKAMLVSHLHGGLANMPVIRRLADEHRVAIVEDACQSPGAMVAGRRAGTWGDVGVLSFGGSKLLTAGRGGAIIARQAEVQQRAKLFGDRGNQAFPLSELQAAVLLPQLARLDADNAQRLVAVERLLQAATDWAGLRPLVNGVHPASPSYYKFGLHYVAGSSDVDEFVAAAQRAGVPLDRGFRGFALRSSRRCRRVGDLPNSRRAAETCLVLHHPVLLEPAEKIAQVAAALRRVCHQFAAK